jgi:DNA-binding LacI/PurR family transcriptional regulator
MRTVPEPEDRPEQSRFPSIKQVADRAGVSPSTASRVLRRQGYASSRAQQRVERAARELGYEPDLVAQALKSRSSHMVGLVVQDITNPFYGSVAKGIGDVTRRAGLVLLLSDSQEEPEREAESLQVMAQSRVAGVIVTPTSENAELLRSIQRRGIALVQVDRTVPHVPGDTVVIDNFRGAYAGTRHLLDLGHTDIGVITGPQAITTGRMRLLGFRAAMKEKSVPVKRAYVKVSDYRRATAFKLADELLEENPAPTAVFTHNNVLTECLLEVILQRRLRVPEDIAVLGFDDPPWAQLVSPGLTVIRQPAYELGVMAADLLIRRLTRSGTDPAPPPAHVVLQPTLIVRESCGEHVDDVPARLSVARRTS